MYLQNIEFGSNHTFFSSVMQGSQESIFGVLHRLDFGLKFHLKFSALPYEYPPLHIAQAVNQSWSIVAGV